MKNFLFLSAIVLFLISCKKNERLGDYNIQIVDMWTGEGVDEATVTIHSNRNYVYKVESTGTTDSQGRINLVRDYAGLYVNASSAMHGLNQNADSLYISTLDSPFNSGWYLLDKDTDNLITLQIPAKCWIKFNLTDVGEQSEPNTEFRVRSISENIYIPIPSFENGGIVEVQADQAYSTLELLSYNWNVYPDAQMEIELIHNDTITVNWEY